MNEQQRPQTQPLAALTKVQALMSAQMALHRSVMPPGVEKIYTYEEAIDELLIFALALSIDMQRPIARAIIAIVDEVQE